MKRSRRAVLGMGAAAAAGLAGCSSVSGVLGDGDGADPGDDAPENGTETETETPAGDDAAANETTTTTTTAQPSAPSLADRGASFEDFEDPERWFVLQDQGTVEPTTEGAYRGSQSMHLSASVEDAFAGVYKAFTEPRDLSGKNLSLAVRLQRPDIAKLSVALLAPDEGNMVRMTRTFPGPTDTWLRSDMGVTTVRRDPDLSQVQEIRIVARRRSNDATPIDVTIDDIRLVDAPDTGYVTFTFDDAPRSHYTKAFPVMEEYGFAGVEGVIADAVYEDDRLDVGMMREMRDAGWDMASHPYTGANLLTSFSEKKQRKRIRENKQFLVRKGFPEGARHFVTPKNMRGPKTMEIVRENHETMYTFGGMPNGFPPTTTYNFGRINGRNTETVKRFIDNAATYGQYLVLNVHAIGNGGTGPITEEDFRALVDYVDRADVEGVTAADVRGMQRG